MLVFWRKPLLPVSEWFLFFLRCVDWKIKKVVERSRFFCVFWFFYILVRFCAQSWWRLLIGVGVGSSHRMTVPTARKKPKAKALISVVLPMNRMRSRLLIACESRTLTTAPSKPMSDPNAPPMMAPIAKPFFILSAQVISISWCCCLLLVSILRKEERKK